MKAFSLLAFLAPAGAIDNGLGLTPPQGWRSWNLYGANVNQKLIEGIMDGMTSKKRMVDGVPTSLCDLGFCDVGLDDNWQKCGAGHTYHYHDDSGKPIVNHDRFPDMAAMTAHAHKLGLTAGWYGNNCICAEKVAATHAMYQEDVNALVGFGFDGVKLDGCGTQRDLDLWSSLINKTGRPVKIENCHWGGTVPNATWCPWNFFRTSGDVRAVYSSVVANLQTTIQWAQKGLSKPGCWGYPDMLEVGCAHGPGGASDPGLNAAETRSHFASWCIVSSPLTLSHDVNNDTITDKIWPLISNKEALAINQDWAGHSGSPFKQAESSHVTFDDAKVPSWQYFYKPLSGGKVAVLMMNHDSKSQDFTLNFSDVPQLKCSKCKVRDVFARKDIGEFETTFTAQDVASHDSVFLVISAATLIV